MDSQLLALHRFAKEHKGKASCSFVGSRSILILVRAFKKAGVVREPRVWLEELGKYLLHDDSGKEKVHFPREKAEIGLTTLSPF